MPLYSQYSNLTLSIFINPNILENNYSEFLSLMTQIQIVLNLEFIIFCMTVNINTSLSLVRTL